VTIICLSLLLILYVISAKQEHIRIILLFINKNLFISTFLLLTFFLTESSQKKI